MSFISRVIDERFLTHLSTVAFPFIVVKLALMTQIKQKTSGGWC